MCVCVWGAGGRFSSPLAHSEVARGASAQVAPLGVGAAVVAGVLARGALVQVLAAAAELVEVVARGAGTLEAAQRVVAGRRATAGGVGAFVLI